jgi:uncharacterized protein YjgD (DUF1641 family)
MDGEGRTTLDSPQQQLLKRLDDPRTVAGLERLLDRVDLLAFAAEAGDEFLRRGEQIADNIGESLQEVKAAAPAANGSAIAGKLPQLASAGARLADAASSPTIARLLDSGLLDRLAEPDTIAALQTLLDKLPLFAFAATATEGLLKRGEELTDNVADTLREALNATLPAELGKLREMMASASKLIDAGNVLIAAGIFRPETVEVLAEVGQQLAASYDETKHMPEHRVGIWGALKALRDPDVQRTAGIGVHVLKRFGQTFSRTTAGSDSESDPKR